MLPYGRTFFMGYLMMPSVKNIPVTGREGP
jgi:hypothetical protein